MSETEGTIKFAYELSASSEPIADDELTRPLFAWRTLLRRLGILGQHLERYGGFGFGNLSARDLVRTNEFVISASQTSGLDAFNDEHLARIRHRYASWSRNEPDLVKSSALMIISSCRHGLRAPIAA